MEDDLPPLPVSPRGVRRALIELDRATGAARRGSLLLRAQLGARRAGAGLRLDIHPTASIGHHVVIETWHDTRSIVEIGEGVRLGDHTWISMRGGRLSIGRRTDVRRGVTINCSGTLDVGEEVVLSTGLHLHCANRISIGDWTIIGEYSTLVDSQHVPPAADEPIHHSVAVDEVEVGRNVWIAAKATIASGVHIGDRAIVAGGAVVTRDVPAQMVASGVPARNREAKPGDAPEAED
jgi:acetyltransferase-like isoleucine patch superfamily enzyme